MKMKKLIGWILWLLSIVSVHAQSSAGSNAQLQNQRVTDRTDTNWLNLSLDLRYASLFRSSQLILVDTTYRKLMLRRQNYTNTRSVPRIEVRGNTLFATGKGVMAKPEIDRLTARISQHRSDTNRIQLLLQAAYYFLNRPDELKTDLDQALTYAQEAMALSRSLRFGFGQRTSLVLLGHIYRELQDLRRAGSTIQQAVRLYKQTGQLYEAAEVLVEFGGRLNTNETELPLKITYYQQALTISRQTGDKPLEAYILKGLADVHQHQGKLTQSLAELQQAMHLLQSVRFPNSHYTSDLLAHVYFELGDYREALAYAHQSIKQAQRTHDFRSMSTFYWRLGAIYYQVGKYDKGIIAHKQAISEYIRNRYEKKDFVHFQVLNVIEGLLPLQRNKEALRYANGIFEKYPAANAFQRENDDLTLARCYESLKDYPQAEAYYLNYIAAVEQSLQNRERMGLTEYQYISNFYVFSKQYAKAKFYLEKALKINNQVNSLPDARALYWLYFKADSAQGNLTAAIQHYQRYKALSDSLFNEAKSKQIAQLEIQFETEGKDQDLRLKEQNIQLLKKQSRLQATQIQEALKMRNLIVAGFIMLALLLGLSYNRYRLKQRSNQQLQTQQEEIAHKNESLRNLVTEKEWLLREVHHRVKNNLQIITSLLHSQGVYLKNQAAQAAIRESQNRVHAMALIHQKLYQSEELATIPISEYITEIVTHLIDTFDRHSTVRKQLAIDAINLDVIMAVPLGLIINEAVTNSLKYAFPFDQKGIISVVLTQVDDKNCHLTISDNGIGLPANVNLRKTQTLGLSLMRGLGKQLGGTLQISQTGGVQVRLEFSVETVVRAEQANL